MSDRLDRARAARLARTSAASAGSVRLNEGIARLSQVPDDAFETRPSAERSSVAGDMLARARAARGATVLGSHEGSLRHSREGSPVSLRDGNPQVEAAKGAAAQLAMAKAARLAREEAQPPGPLRRQPGCEAVTELGTGSAVSRVQRSPATMRSNNARPQQGPPPESVPGQCPPETGPSPWELSLYKVVSSAAELALAPGSGVAATPEIAEIPNESLLHPALPGVPRVQCLVRRHRSGLGLYPTYRMYLTRRRQGPLQRDGPTNKREEQGEVFLLSARRRKGVASAGHSFLISRHPTDLEHGPNHVAKLRANLIGSQWTLYDCGANPTKLEKGTATGSPRRELAHIRARHNLAGRHGHRRTRVTLPPLDKSATYLQPHGLAPASSEESLSRGYKKHKQRVAYRSEEEAVAASVDSNSTVSNFTQQTNHAPEEATRELFFFDSIDAEIDPSSGKHSLEFGGRALRNSVKNFQLESIQEPGTVAFMFAKYGKNEYILDYSYPMSPLQAFAMGLSSLSFKIANEATLLADFM